MVRLAPYLVADSIDAYRSDPLDGDNVEAVFQPWELQEALAFRQQMSPDLRALLVDLTGGFCRLNDIELARSDRIGQGGPSPLERITATLDVDAIQAMLEPIDILIDRTGCTSLLHDHLVLEWEPAYGEERNRNTIRMEHAAVATFLAGLLEKLHIF